MPPERSKQVLAGDKSTSGDAAPSGCRRAAVRAMLARFVGEIYRCRRFAPRSSGTATRHIYEFEPLEIDGGTSSFACGVNRAPTVRTLCATSATPSGWERT